MSWEVRVPKSVKKALASFPEDDYRRIMVALREMEVDPWYGDIAKVGEKAHLWRRRIGNYRIFYTPWIKARVIGIKDIERRTSKIY